MALTQTNQHGQTYKWGFESSDAPSITGFTARMAQSDTAPEVFSTATNGEGHVEAVAVSKPAYRQISLSLTGYITDSFDATSVGGTFTFLTRFFIIRKIGVPRKKGEFTEVTIEAESYANVTS